jgi:hypothetical protein
MGEARAAHPAPVAAAPPPPANAESAKPVRARIPVWAKLKG